VSCTTTCRGAPHVWRSASAIDRLGLVARLDHDGHIPAAPPLARALTIEERLAKKVGAQQVAGTNGGWTGAISWHRSRPQPAPHPFGSCAAIVGERAETVLVVRIGKLVEAIVVEGEAARTNPAAAARILSTVGGAEPTGVDRVLLQQALDAAAPSIRSRLAAVQDARWRASDRDRFARRLIPWVLSAARRAARRGDGAQLSALDALVSRLASGMTAGEELLLEDLLSRQEPLLVQRPAGVASRAATRRCGDSPISVELVAALMVVPQRAPQ